MNLISLNGEWNLQQAGHAESIPALVPGCVHTDLLAAHKIPDPYLRDNELELLWIGETDWSYQRPFTISADLLHHDQILLRCHGLDTLATVTLNGRTIGHTDNQFRTWEFPVKDALQPGENQIAIHFAAPVPYGLQRLQERHMNEWGTDHYKVPGGAWLRKSPSNYGWDWGPRLVTSGIWRDIELLAYSTARLEDVAITQEHNNGTVSLTIATAVTRTQPAPLTVQATLTYQDEIIASSETTFTGDTAVSQLTIPNPQLWWPNGMGLQPLYHLTVTLTSNATVLDSQHKRLGLRTLTLDRHTDQWGESFQFMVNGVPFFAKGANWIPADTLVTRITPEWYGRLLQDAAAVHMNMLRVWGGGIYEPDIFYDLCDELGITIWQDFMFACATYPTFDDAWLETVRHEAIDNVRRLRHHACLALWCGNNEMEQGLVGPAWNVAQMSWDDYSRLYDQLLPELLAQHDPQTSYWPSSPHTPAGSRTYFNDPKSGDAHIWGVWHGKEPFEFYRTCDHRFNSEFGFQSFPEPRMVYTYTAPEDRNITSFVMEHHQRSGIGNQTIIHYLLDWFQFPTSFENTLWLSQITQGMAMKYAVEHWRRSMPRGMGTLYWQINDCWPVASWSSLDSDGRWKALHYMARAFYAPVLISGLEDAATGEVQIHVSSDRLEPFAAHILWQLTDTDGTPLANGRIPTTIAANSSHRLHTLHLPEIMPHYDPRRILLWLDITDENGRTLSSNLVHLARPKHLHLPDPAITTEISAIGNGRYHITLTAQKPALWVWLELRQADATFSDNFIHLRPHQPTTITVQLADPTNEQAIQHLRTQSLYDTYQPA
jgi:beta-mannosidase